MTTPAFSSQQVEDSILLGLRGDRRRYELESDEAVQKNATYGGNLAHYRSVAQKCLNEGDYLQAAEKSWGAYAQTIKGISAAHGIGVSTHSNLVSVAQALNALAVDADAAMGTQLRQAFHSARSLHQHFYENDLFNDEVERSVSEVMAAIDLMQALFDGDR